MNDGFVWGPLCLGGFGMPSSSSLSGYALDDSNDSIGFLIPFTKTGMINRIGFNVFAINGTPPNYNIGLTRQDLVTGTPTTIGYGGSTTLLITGSSLGLGWQWFTLTSPATGTAGERAFVYVWPTATIPTAINNISICTDGLYTFYGCPDIFRFVTSWQRLGGAGIAAVEFDDGTINGYPVDALANFGVTGTNNSEWGALFTLPFTGKSSGALFHTEEFVDVDFPFQVILYDVNDTVLRSVTVSDVDQVSNVGFVSMFTWAQVTLDENAQYRIVVKSTGSGKRFWGVGVEMDQESYKTTLPGGADWDWTYRVSAGAWDDTQTKKVPWIGLLIDEITSMSGATGTASTAYGYVG